MTDFLSSRIAAMTPGPSVIGSLTYIDRSGQWWIAPLGSPEPEIGAPLPAAWVPIKHLKREDIGAPSGSSSA